MKTIAEMTKDEQIERLVKQRNALWSLLREIVPPASSLGDDEEDPIQELLNDVETEIVDGKIQIIIPSPYETAQEERDRKDAAYRKMEEIVGNLYVVEGYDPVTETENSELPEGYELYRRGGDVW